MVKLYVAGQPVGTAADLDRLLPEIAANNQLAEVRDEAGRLIGRFVPAAEPLCPWEPGLTAEEIDRRVARGGGSSLAEFWQKMGVS